MWKKAGSLAVWLAGSPGPSSYWLTRFLLLRLLGLVYFAAFFSLSVQLLPLIGSRGLLPAGDFLQRVQDYFGTRSEAFHRLPSLFWWNSSDSFMQAMAIAGAALSLIVLCGFADGLLLGALWVLYLSFNPVGQAWLGYGWEIQLLETGFLAIFLVPLLDGRPFPKRPPPLIVILLFRWLIFRIMLGAGLIKIRGDSCWRNLTCLQFHYETQPIPNPLSPVLHFMPKWFHTAGALFNHLVELIVPWFSFGPRKLRHAAGILMGLFQVLLILSGNLSFLNWLTLVPVLACFDDSLLERVLPGLLIRRARRAAAQARPAKAQGVAVASLALVVVWLSVGPVGNLLSSRQAMNTSFDALHLVNTYGAFGSVGRERLEIVFEGTFDDPGNPNAEWRPYEFPCKPGDPMRRPCIAGPYQFRLDWQIWFAAMSSADRYPWTVHLAWKLLHNDPGALGLLADNPFPDIPPRYVRAVLFRYRFAPLSDPAWWKRTEVGRWLRPLSRDDPDLIAFLRAYGWE